MAENSLTTQEKWDALYRNSETPPDVAQVLRENAHLLPASGKALDFACGLGTNALFLAAQGLETHAWDISPVAITLLTETAKARGLTLQGNARDLAAQPPLANEASETVRSAADWSRPMEEGVARTQKWLSLNGLSAWQWVCCRP